MNKKNIIIGMLIIILVIFVTGCVETLVEPEQPIEPEPLPGLPPIEDQKLIVAGSTSVAVVATSLAEAFMEKHPDVVVEIHSLGSTAGVVGAHEGTTDIGMTSRNLRGDELGWGLREFVICHDAIAAIVHPENPVTDISTEDLKRIFIGEITNWNEVGGRDQTITVVIREDGSGTRNAFEDLVHEDIDPIPTVIMPGTRAVKARVAEDARAIGYITVAALTDIVSPLKIDGVEASPAAVLDGTYGIARPFILLTKGEADPLEQKFIDFVLGPDGQRMLEDEGIVRVN